MNCVGTTCALDGMNCTWRTTVVAVTYKGWEATYTGVQLNGIGVSGYTINHAMFHGSRLFYVSSMFLCRH